MRVSDTLIVDGFIGKINMIPIVFRRNGSMTRKFLSLLFAASMLLLAGCIVNRRLVVNTPEFQPEKPALPTLHPIEPTAATEVTNAKMYLIALEDAGKSGPAVGCGDSLVAVDIPGKDGKAAMQYLLGLHNDYYGQSGLYNALYQSDLKIDRINATAENINVELTGTLLLGGVCDNPRVHDQLIATIRQSTESKVPVILRINGVPLDDLLSQK
jgi:hypothetical protein